MPLQKDLHTSPLEKGIPGQCKSIEASWSSMLFLITVTVSILLGTLAGGAIGFYTAKNWESTIQTERAADIQSLETQFSGKQEI